MALDSGLVINRQAIEKLQSHLNDSAYRDAIENSASYNTRLSLEKRMRLPFLDAQTGVAQNHCNLWMEPRHRMPGEQPGQMYTYPAKRWKKKRRSYLTNFVQVPRRRELPQGDNDMDISVAADNQGSAMTISNEDSKDSAAVGIKEDGSKEAWLYEELQAEADDFEEPEPDSDYDYEESYSKKKKKKTPAKTTTPKATTRGRKKQIPVNYDATDTEKPYSCETCGARYKTRPGLTYHYTHTHKNLLEDDDEDSSSAAANSNPGTGSMPSTPMSLPHPNLGTPNVPPNTGYMDTPTGSRSRSSRQNTQQQQQQHLQQHQPPQQLLHGPPPPQQQHQLQPPHGFMGGVPMETTPRKSNAPPPPTYAMMQPPPPAPVVQQPPVNYGMPVASPAVREMEMRPRAPPSSYCDFCLGDATENKKTGNSEELVSCADCGRSGHPSCLQFTPNMIISVKQYRWQCIECKCCSLCGNSDNDDQLLFCDDCDRGYHMYCLKPPLTEPPEGSWSCHLCLVIFHRK